MNADNYTLKEQFVMEKRVGVAFITSRPYDHYPTSKEIIEYIATLAPVHRDGGVRVVKEHVLVKAEGTPSEAAKLRGEDGKSLTDEATLGYMEQEETASQAAERIRKEVFGAGVGSIKVIQALEVKIAIVESRMLMKTKRILMSTRQGRMLIPDGLVKAPPVGYRGIPITYTEEDMDEPLVCW